MGETRIGTKPGVCDDVFLDAGDLDVAVAGGPLSLCLAN